MNLQPNFRDRSLFVPSRGPGSAGSAMHAASPASLPNPATQATHTAGPDRRPPKPTGKSRVTLSVVSDQSQKEQLVKLYEEHYGSLVRLASFLLDDVESCEEVVQDAFVKLYTTARPTPGKEVPYLRAMVLNGARGRMRWRLVRKRHVHEIPEPVASAESDAMSRHERERMLDALKRLPRRQSEVLILRYYQDLSEVEIAETLGISQGSVKTHSSRGLAALKSLLADGAAGTGPGAK